jgi:cytochrome c biogenesis protein CcdA
MSDGLLALALGAGMLAAVNPCGFALLPAYLSLLVLGDRTGTRPHAVARALWLSAAMTLGFSGVFAAFGLAIAPVASGIQRHLPWFTVVLGLVLAALGLMVLAGRQLTLPRLGGRGRPRALTATFGSMAGFGAGYAVASLSCTIAPFLAVVVAGFRTESTVAGLALFVAYAAGMGLVVGAVAVATALTNDGLIKAMRRSGRWVPRVSGLLLLVAGAYVSYYGWWELRVLDGATTSDPVIEVATQVQHAMASLVQAPGALGWLLGGLALVGITLVASRLGRRSS